METGKITKAKLKMLHSLEELLYRKSLEEISVIDIVEKAGVARKTFYRHFQDKYEALNFYFFLFYQESFEKINEGEDWEAALYNYLCVCEEKAKVLLHAYAGIEYGGLLCYDVEMTEKTYQKYLLQKGVDIDTKEMKFAIRIAAYGGTEMIIEWIRSGMPEDKKTLVDLIKRTLPKDIYENLFCLQN